MGLDKTASIIRVLRVDKFLCIMASPGSERSVKSEEGGGQRVVGVGRSTDIDHRGAEWNA